MTDDEKKQLAYYVAWIAENHPKHDRTSCNDNTLYNAGTVTLPHRCDRCESLSMLKAWKMERIRYNSVKIKRPYEQDINTANK